MAITHTVHLVLLLVVGRCSGWHDFTNADFHCWPLTASESKPETLTPCPGLSLAWHESPPEEIKAEKVFNVTFILMIEDAFWEWAVQAPQDVFGYQGISTASTAHTWCTSTSCPAEKAEVDKSNCCFHHINVHSCPLSESSFCGPWLQPLGDTYTHSDAIWGPGEESAEEGEVLVPGTEMWEWTGIVNGLHVEGVTQLIAHIKLADMQLALFADIHVLPKTVCGDGLCELSDGEDCSVCPADCGRCPLTIPQISAITVSVIIIAIIIISGLGYLRWKQQKMLWDESWIVSAENIKGVTQNTLGMRGSMILSQMLGSAKDKSALSKMSVSAVSDNGSNKLATNAENRQLFTKTAILEGRILAIRDVPKAQFQLTKAVRKEVKAVRSLDHPNLCRFVAACIVPGEFCLLTEYCAKGSLSDVLQNEDVPLNWGFRFSFAGDIARGMLHLASNKLHHGRLKSNNCVIDDRWTAKVTDYGLASLRSVDKEAIEDDWEAEYHAKRTRVYQSPELRQGLQTTPSTPADVYAYGIILIELASRNDPYGDESPETVAEDWSPSIPELTDASDPDNSCPCPEQYARLIDACMGQQPSDRPSFDTIKKNLSRINPNKKSPVDMMMSMMEKYSKHLESLVGERTQDLIAEKQKTDRLLYSMLPRTVADDLKHGKIIDAVQFSTCTIYFSDIVGFTSISAQSTPLEVVALLNKLYTCFDAIMDQHDVYKVETIGDAYMVVSGVPTLNGDRHAAEVANMSIELVVAAKIFSIPHLPSQALRIRVGLHSGPVCAGVVGLKMPRYCLFGDTVNTASRMESNGEPYRIHLSDSTYSLLHAIGGYIMTKRGTIPVKGKGDMTTWWLMGTDSQPLVILDGE